MSMPDLHPPGIRIGVTAQTVGLAIAILAQTCGAIWWASGVSNNLGEPRSVDRSS